MSLPLDAERARLARNGELVPSLAVYPVINGRRRYWVGIAELNFADQDRPECIQYAICFTRLGAWAAIAWALWRSGLILPDRLEEDPC